MRIKKNPKVELSRRSLLFFQVGLAVMLLITWRAIEWKTYEKKTGTLGRVEVSDFLVEEVPVTQDLAAPPPPPPPPPVASEIIDVFEDEDDVEETIIESTEASQESVIAPAEPVRVTEIKEEKIEEEIAPVPFAVIENVPVYPGCENEKSNEDKRHCMSVKISQLVNKNFNTGLADDTGLEGKQRIAVIFRIDTDGQVVEVQARAPHPMLEKEAVRVVRMLPVMEPGRQRGKPVSVLYSLPIVFDIQ